MIVLPPERSVKYEAFKNAFCGIKIAVIIIKYFASSLASAFVLFRFGNNVANTSIAKATIVQHNTENAIILLSVSRASFILPHHAGSGCYDKENPDPGYAAAFE